MISSQRNEGTGDTDRWSFSGSISKGSRSGTQPSPLQPHLSYRPVLIDQAYGGRSKSAYRRNESVYMGCQALSWLSILSVCVFCPIGYRPESTLDLHQWSLLPKVMQMQQLGDRAKWLWKIAPKASYLWCVLFCFFPFAVVQEPKHPPLLSCMVKWPGSMPVCFTRWLGCGGCCMRWADNTPQCCKQDTPPSCSHPAGAPAACCFVMACHDLGVSSQIGEPIVLFPSPCLSQI